MAYVAHPREFQSAVPFKYPAQQVTSRRAATKPSIRRRGFWRRLYDAIMLAHQRDVEREIGRYVARRGKLTDSMEREITERLLGNSSRGF